ncbi:hypothetical protein ACWFMI_23795 [Nocardiopsis terrae]|uniref:hypothetical protein n=1 Tax=Streptomyces sp. NPDC057554 TaxID=3350538 RepID=UPI0036944E66
MSGSNLRGQLASALLYVWKRKALTCEHTQLSPVSDMVDAVMDALTANAQRDRYEPRTEVEAHADDDRERLIAAWEDDQERADVREHQLRTELAQLREQHSYQAQASAHYDLLIVHHPRVRVGVQEDTSLRRQEAVAVTAGQPPMSLPIGKR